DTLPDDYLDIVASIDAAGVPALGFTLLTAAGSHLARRDPELADRLLQEAGWFAQAARQPLDFVATLGELESWRLDQNRTVLDGELGAHYVQALATADRRLQLGRRALAQAQAAADLDAAVDLLALARELFVSVGDALNVAIVEFRLAKLEAGRGRLDPAGEHLERGRLFELVSNDPALTALRRQLEEELAGLRQP